MPDLITHSFADVIRFRLLMIGAGYEDGNDASSRIYFRADAGFANPDVYEFLEAEGIKDAIRLPANRVLQERIGHLLKRPVGRPSNDVRRSHASFSYQAEAG